MTNYKTIQTESVLNALKLWHGGDPPKWPLAHLRLYRQLAQESSKHSTLADSGPSATNRAILNKALKLLHDQHPDAEDLLRQRFEHRRDVLSVANSLNVSESSLFYRQRQAINQLTDILQAMEQEASQAWQEQMLERLELPSYTELVGIEQPRQKLINALLDEEEHFIIAIAGLGGLGKTALADRVTRDIIQTSRFDEIAWVTAKHTYLSTMGRLQVESGRPSLTFPMLIDRLSTQFQIPHEENGSQLQRQRIVKNYLQKRACLVIIDNLETVADSRSLLPELRKWQNPSKFLLTSRLRLLDEANVFSLSLQELPETAAIQLIRIEAKKRGFADLANANNKQLQEIYKTVGGNPLALKLIVGQLRFHALPHVLNRFSATNSPKSQEDIFQYIFQEMWDTLGENSKRTLIALTHAGESGFTFDHIREIANLPESTLTHCLEELILLSLVDQKGTLLERRYRLHRLTELFLLRMLEEDIE
ncbi:MAG: hypothetical protein Kow0080_34210 [Candidatus Promineifilaceae bacterium]